MLNFGGVSILVSTHPSHFAMYFHLKSSFLHFESRKTWEVFEVSVYQSRLPVFLGVVDPGNPLFWISKTPSPTKIAQLKVKGGKVYVDTVWPKNSSLEKLGDLKKKPPFFKGFLSRDDLKKTLWYWGSENGHQGWCIFLLNEELKNTRILKTTG